MEESEQFERELEAKNFQILRELARNIKNGLARSSQETDSSAGPLPSSSAEKNPPSSSAEKNPMNREKNGKKETNHWDFGDHHNHPSRKVLHRRGFEPLVSLPD